MNPGSLTPAVFPALGHNYAEWDEGEGKRGWEAGLSSWTPSTVRPDHEVERYLGLMVCE